MKSNEQEILRKRVEFIINKFGYKTSYAENMLDAIEKTESYQQDGFYSIIANFGVIKQCKDITVRHDKGNQFVMLYELHWNLNELLGEYILNQNPNYFDEN